MIQNIPKIWLSDVFDGDARIRYGDFHIIFFTNSYVYKLSDFGTAKPLKDGDFFQSLVGTEEYLVNKFYIVDRVL